jgi:hypothetical protein
MLAEHYRVWRDYPSDLRARLHVVVVDDCSPIEFQVTIHDCPRIGLGSLQVYRCLEKRRWNWLFARNLGVAMAPTHWVLLTDIDHVMPPSTALQVLNGEYDPENVYRLSRVDAAHPWPYDLAECPVREKKRIHPNTWLLTRPMFQRVGGYDERLSGCYGTDGEFRDRIREQAKSLVLLSNVELVRYPREVIPDASTTIYTRKNDPENDAELARRRIERARVDPQWRPLNVTFPYETILCRP